ncbi:MAG: OmpA family protein [Pseudomonadales bacterium]|nr:OmpA family protein [Pseudomonadales bacterium]
MSNKLCGGIFLVLLVCISGGCSSWPGAMGGGYGSEFIGLSETVFDPKVAYAQMHVVRKKESLDMQLDILQLKGAQRCVPARYLKLHHLSNRIAQEIHGQLFEDAKQDLIIMEYELKRLNAVFRNVSERTRCSEAVMRQSLKKPTQAFTVLSIYFDTDSAEVSLPYQYQLRALSTFLAEQPLNLTILGYTDIRGAEAHNLALARARGEAVMGYLKKGTERFQAMKLQVLGETTVTSFEQSESGHARNRRVDIVVQSSAHQADVGLEQTRHHNRFDELKGWEPGLQEQGVQAFRVFDGHTGDGYDPQEAL